jgi:hypothetical protein
MRKFTKKGGNLMSRLFWFRFGSYSTSKFAKQIISNLEREQELYNANDTQQLIDNFYKKKQLKNLWRDFEYYVTPKAKKSLHYDSAIAAFQAKLKLVNGGRRSTRRSRR